MWRVKIRALCLTLFTFACVAPAANAAVADTILPFYDAADGVRVVHRSSGEDVIRFDAKAAKIYKTIAGKTVTIGCGAVFTEPEGEGPLAGAGFGVRSKERLPKRRGTVRLGISKAVEFCSISTKKAKDEALCLPPERGSKLCVRVAVAVKPAGAAYLDLRARTIELAFSSSMLGAALTPDFNVPGATTLEKMRSLLGPDVVELATPEDSPAAGKLGYWTDTKNFTLVVLLADATRRFVRVQDGVFSTNDLNLTGLDDENVFTLS
jgi:hypothetical protein